MKTVNISLDMSVDAKSLLDEVFRVLPIDDILEKLPTDDLKDELEYRGYIVKEEEE